MPGKEETVEKEADASRSLHPLLSRNTRSTFKRGAVVLCAGKFFVKLRRELRGKSAARFRLLNRGDLSCARAQLPLLINSHARSARIDAEGDFPRGGQSNRAISAISATRE